MRLFLKCFMGSGDRKEDFNSKSRGALSSETQSATTTSEELRTTAKKNKNVNLSSRALNTARGDCLPQLSRIAHPVAAHSRALKAPRQAGKPQTRDALVLRCLPAMITMVSTDGRILHQNLQSKAYYGDHTHGHDGADLHTNILVLLFALEPGKLESMREAMAAQRMQSCLGPWKAVMRVPQTLNVTPVIEHMRAHFYDACSFEMMKSSAIKDQHNDTTSPRAAPPRTIKRDKEPSGIALHFERVAPSTPPITVLEQLECEPHFAIPACTWANSKPKDEAGNMISTLLLSAGKDPDGKVPMDMASSSSYAGVGNNNMNLHPVPSNPGVDLFQEAKRVPYPADCSLMYPVLPTTSCTTGYNTSTTTTTFVGGYSFVRSQQLLAAQQPVASAGAVHTAGSCGGVAAGSVSSRPSGTCLHIPIDMDNNSFTHRVAAATVCGYSTAGRTTPVGAMTRRLTTTTASGSLMIHACGGGQQHQQYQQFSQMTTAGAQLGDSVRGRLAESMSSVDPLGAVLTPLWRGNSTVHDPLATSTFSILARNAPFPANTVRTNTQSPRQAAVVPSGSMVASRSDILRNSHDFRIPTTTTNTAATAIISPPSQGSNVGGLHAPSNQHRPRPSMSSRRTASFYLGPHQQLPPTPGHFRSSITTSGSRALTFALSLGTSPVIPPPSPHLQRDQHHSRLDLEDTSAPLSSRFSRSALSMDLSGAAKGGLSLVTVPLTLQGRNSAAGSNCATMVATAPLPPPQKARCTTAGNLSGTATPAIAAMTSAEDGKRQGEAVTAALSSSTAPGAAALTREWGPSMEGKPPEDTLTGEGPMFGLTFVCVDASKQQEQQQQAKQQRSLGDWRRDRSLHGPADVGPACEGRDPVVVGPQRLLQLAEGQTGTAVRNEGHETAVAAAAASAATQGCWHEVWVSSLKDPVTGQEALMLTQIDVTDKVIAERHLALVMETEHRLIEQLFPRHILQYITEEWTEVAAETDAAVATPNTRALGPGDSRRQGSGIAAAMAGGASSWPQQPSYQPPATYGVSDRVCIRDDCIGDSSHWQPVIRDCTPLATTHSEVTLLFADIPGFTPMCNEVEPRQTMTLLNELYSRYDALLDEYGVYKVETIGDCYFVAGGLMREDEDGMTAVCDRSSKEDPLHAERVLAFAKAMLVAARQVVMPTNGQPVEIRVGLHTGPVVSGVVGTRMPRFCLFGDTVNTASRMESTGVPGAIHASAATFRRLPRTEQAKWKPTGGIQVKGKGLMQTYLWMPSAAESN